MSSTEETTESAPQVYCIRLTTLEEAREHCEELLDGFDSIKIALGLLFEWKAVGVDEKFVYTQETLPAFVLDKEEIETGEWEKTWDQIYEQVDKTTEFIKIVSNLIFQRIIRVKLNWFQYQIVRAANNINDERRGVLLESRRANNISANNEVSNNEENSNENQPEVTAETSSVLLNRMLFIHLLYICYRIENKLNIPRNRKFTKRVIEQFTTKFNLDRLVNSVANLSNIANLCADIHDISIIVYNKRNNIIFEHLVEDCEFTANLYWNETKMLVIKNIATFLNKTSPIGTFCAHCKRIHQDMSACENRNIELGVFERPFNRDGQEVSLTMYCDIEAICPVDQRQYACCYSLITSIDGETISIDEQMIAREDEIESDLDAETELMATLFKTIEVKMSQFFGWGDSGLQPNWFFTRCEWCNFERFCCNLRPVVKNYAGKKFENICKVCIGNNKTKFEPVIFFHNFSKYDICFVLRYLAQNYKLVIAGKSTELIYNISSRKTGDLFGFKLRDSMHFVSGSIYEFSKEIPQEKWDTEELAEYYSLFEGMKGDFAYEWLQNRRQLFEAFPDDDTVQRNKLSGKEIKLSDLAEHCRRFDLQTVGEYLQKYCTVDVIVLMFYFDAFRAGMFNEFNIDIAQFYSISSVSWYIAMRNESECQVPKSVEDYLLIRDNIRGGVSQCVLRAAEIGKENIKSIKMLDVNALYSWCMTQDLPVVHIETITILRDDPRNWFELLNMKEKDETWLCCVDLEYPEDLHLLHEHFAFPLAPHRYNNRLCTTFFEKLNYLVLDELLIYYLNKGLKITRWHSVQIWRKKAIFKDFVEQNILARNSTEDPIIKNARKITNNFLYGKTCENVFKYKQFVVDKIESEENENGTINMHTKNWLNFTILDSEYAVAEVRKEKIILNKPVQLGFAILEFAKLRIYEFWAALCEVFGEDVYLLYTDTDSLLLGFIVDDPFEIIRNHEATKKFVDLPIDALGQEMPPLKTIGLFSDELHNRTIKAYIGLKAKSYIIDFEDGDSKKRMKGIRRSALYRNRPLEYIDFYEALFNSEEKTVYEYSLRKKTFTVKLIGTNKKALSNYDAKHQYTENLVEAVPWGFDLNRLE